MAPADRTTVSEDVRRKVLQSERCGWAGYSHRRHELSGVSARGGNSMTHTVTLKTQIPDSRLFQVQLPSEVPVGDADVVVVVIPSAERRRSTAQDILASDLFGMWADRADIADSAEFAEELRQRAWGRTCR
jgi:hypothetical protein